MTSVALDGLQRIQIAFRGNVLQSFLQPVGEPQDGVERCTQFMGYAGQELGLRLI